MRGTSSLPRLPPVKVSRNSLTNAIISETKPQKSCHSPFSTPAVARPQQILTPTELDEPDSLHSTSGRDSAQRSSSYWASKFQAQSKGDFVRGDVAPLLERFEDIEVYRHPQRKSLQTILDEMNSQACSQSHLKTSKDAKLSLLRRQASDLMAFQRQYRQSSFADTTKAIIKKNYNEKIKASALEPPPKVVPTRFLFDATRYQRSSRCDYCNFAGGELECAACNVVAHARCYLAAYEGDNRKTKLTFVAPTTTTTNTPFSSWLCSHCNNDLTVEYDERSAGARAAHLAARRQVLANALTAYVRMMRDASAFATKKASIIKIQAILRGRQARQHFERLQRMRLKPYAMDALRVRGIFPFGTGCLQEGLGLGISSSSSLEDLRLGNGFSCNPFLYVTVVSGNDEDTQHFCFETSVRKPTVLNGLTGTTGPAELDIVWPEKMFVPGADGNATFCFTLLSKNGPNTFFLGQAVLRLLETGDCWRTGLTTELELTDHIEVFPKTAQHQPLSLADAAGTAPRSFDEVDEKNLDKEIARNKGKPRWLVSVHIRPFGEQHSHCGYLNMKSTLESFHSSSRWCVLADGVLRIYRHYGVTLASDVVDMAHATDVRVVPITSSAHRAVAKKLGHIYNTSGDGSESVAGTTVTGLSSVKRHPRLPEHSCLAVHHLTRLYLFQCENNAHLREWLKKLQLAQKYSQIQQTHSTAVLVGGSCST
ncbi:unnamed protein product [Phytophthora fragariaefolia]|uniref:Unnamed protein product n=1 Tax=Phytophthora fragariaefolia TaxID=1490495 RepID=A0A9W6XKA9_9STRA|nr:unnamed protein product [Phytophthora fragariaefolia]